MALIFPFLKAFYYEIARATKQKYFIYAFNTFYLGLLTLIIGIGVVFLLASLVFWILAWVKFKEFDEQELSNLEERLAKTQKKVFDFDLKWIKITMALSLALSFISFLFLQSIIYDFIKSFDFLNFQELIYLYLIFLISILAYAAIILASLSVFLLCKKLKTYKMFIYFLVWQALVILEWYSYSIAKSIMGEDNFFINIIFGKIINIIYIIPAFFFFRTLVQVTKEKLFYLVFAFFVLSEILSHLFFVFIWTLDNIRLKEKVVEMIHNISIPFLVAYFISFLIVWLSLKGQKEVKKVI
ncbi:TPA: hypothetical protein RZK15_001353 [Campylobacter coli]|nr:hypothetical protein [Campylobacter coli]HEB9344630.1 hypothetical protein [Campylobacter coli]